MRVVKLTILLSVVIVARCIPLTTQQTQAHESTEELLTDDEIRERLAGIADVSSDDIEQVQNLNDVVDSEVRTDEDDIKSRFWFWDKPKIKKPVKIVTGTEALLHKPIIHHAEENPGIIRPIIDKIKKPINAVIDKTSEVAHHILEKPHKVLQKLGLEKPSIPIIKPVEHLETINENNHETIEHLLNKPTINEWASHEEFNPNDSIEDHEFIKPTGIASVVEHKPIPDKTSILDHIKRPIESILNKPAEIAASIFHKPKPALDIPHIVDDIKKPVEVILNKPVEIASHLINRPSLTKPSIIDHIKEPVNSILNKPAEIASDIFNKPKPESEIFHFPTEDYDQDHSVEPHDSVISITPSHKPTFSNNKLTGFYTGIHKFRPDMGFVDYGFLEPDQKPQTTERPSQDWEPFWDSPYPISFAEPSFAFPKRPQKVLPVLPQSAHYGITSGVNFRDFDPEDSQDFERLISMVPFRQRGGFFYL